MCARHRLLAGFACRGLTLLVPYSAVTTSQQKVQREVETRDKSFKPGRWIARSDVIAAHQFVRLQISATVRSAQPLESQI